MGTSQSKLEDVNIEAIKAHVAKLGAKYHAYGEAIDDNAVNGEVLAAITSEEEMKETLSCLEIKNFLHQKVLINEWKKVLLGQDKTGIIITGKQSTSLGRAGSMGDASGLTLETDLSTSMGSGSSRPHVQLLEAVSAQAPAAKMPTEPRAPPDLPLIISLEHQRVIEPLHLPKPKELLPPESSELAPFRELAKQVLADLHCSIAETNLLDISHFENRKGMNNLATAFPPGADLPAMRCHFDQPDDLEVCRRFVLGQNEEYYEEYVPADVAIANGLSEAGRYYGQVIKIGDLRVGTICGIVEEKNWANTTDKNRKESLRFLATLMEQQLERRQVLLQRNQNLKQDIDQLKNSNVDKVLAPANGLVKAVLASQVASRHTLFPYPQEPELGQDDGHPSSPEFTRRSYNLPSWHFSHLASHVEKRHLATDNTESWFPGADPTPVGKHDMERVAKIHTLQILQMDPLSQEAQTIQTLVTMAGNLLGSDFAFISVMDHQHQNICYPTFPKGRETISEKMVSSLLANHEVVQSHPKTGDPFVFRSERRGSICNYTVMTPSHQTFVVHDMAKDQSLCHFKDVFDVGFYSGSPVVLRGHAVAALCLFSEKPRPDFGRAHEIQQEQLAQLVSQQYDTWCLKREMTRLERERNLFISATTTPSLVASLSRSGEDILSLCKMRSNLPEDYGALIFTEIQGVADMKRAGSEVLESALVLHNEILRTKIAEHGGYELSAEEGAFHVAFTDVVDATKFCLYAQEALHSAPWRSDILALPEACEDTSSCFRGLRVCMAVHCGDVDSTTSQLSGQVAYGGETVHIAKGLLSMSHGGQILLSSDVWNIVSHVTESALGSPQVIDLGIHVLSSKSGNMRDGIITKNVLQLTPNGLAHDYNQSRRMANQDTPEPKNVSGRVFPPIKTKKLVSPSFHSAPCDDNTVCMLSVATSELEGLVTDTKMLLVGLSNRIGTVLTEGCHRGYQCEDFLLAFEAVTDAVRFGLALQESLGNEDVVDVSLAGKVKIGVQEGIFETMGPSPMSGRAEYVGEVVSRVVHVAEAAAPGCVFMGKEATDMDEFNLMPVTNGFMLDYTGRTHFDSFEEEFLLYKCHPCKSWYDQMLDNRRCDLSAPWRGY